MANEQTLEEQYPDLSKAYGPGKFDTYLDVYLWELSQDGCDEETGCSANDGAWYGLLNGPFEHQQLAGIAGAILYENGQGFVHARTFQDKTSLEKAWKIILETTTEE
jgi:hypothetical protein